MTFKHTTNLDGEMKSERFFWYSKLESATTIIIVIIIGRLTHQNRSPCLALTTEFSCNYQMAFVEFIQNHTITTFYYITIYIMQ